MPLLPALLVATTLLPGLWEYKATLVGLGEPERKCLTKAEIDRFLSDPSNRHYACDYSTRQVGGGSVRLEGVCSKRKKPSEKIGMSLAGTYTPTTIEMKGTARPRFAGLELPLSAAVSAQRVGECEAQAPSP